MNSLKMRKITVKLITTLQVNKKYNNCKKCISIKPKKKKNL